MPDPNYIGQNSEPRLPEEWKAKYLARPLDKLPRDVNVAFDRIGAISREKDQIQNQLLQAQKDLRRANNRVKLIWGLFVGTWGGILAVLKWVVPMIVEAVVKK